MRPVVDGRQALSPKRRVGRSFVPTHACHGDGLCPAGGAPPTHVAGPGRPVRSRNSVMAVAQSIGLPSRTNGSVRYWRSVAARFDEILELGVGHFVLIEEVARRDSRRVVIKSRQGPVGFLPVAPGRTPYRAEGFPAPPMTRTPSIPAQCTSQGGRDEV